MRNSDDVPYALEHNYHFECDDGAVCESFPTLVYASRYADFMFFGGHSDCFVYDDHMTCVYDAGQRIARDRAEFARKQLEHSRARRKRANELLENGG